MKITLFRKLLVFPIVMILPLTLVPATSRSEMTDATSQASLPLSSLSVPEELGKVSERFNSAGSTRTVIQIQDVHAHAVAQQNIAAILERLRTVFGIGTAALEGAWSSTSLPKSHAIPTSRKKQLLAGTLLEKDRISGPIYAAIMSPDPILLVGVEEEALYEKNRRIFLDHLAKAPEIRSRLDAYGKDLRSTQQASWNPDLLAFAGAFGKFRDTPDLGQYLPLLLKTAETRGAVVSDLAQVLLLRDTLALEKSLVKERLESEVKQIIKKYKDRPWTLEELIRGGKIPPEEIGLYPEIKKLNRIYQLRDQMALKDLMDQIGTLTTRVLETLIKSPEERALWEKTERFYLARRLLLLQATPSDTRDYASGRQLLEEELAKAGLSEALALSVSFYEAVQKRDEIFFGRIVNDPALAGNIVVVTGGFHTDGLSQKFRDSGISYITITPHLGGTAADEKLYETRMAEGGGRKAETQAPSPSLHPSPGSQTLSELRNAIAAIDTVFPPALETLEETNDLNRSEARFAGEDVAVPLHGRIAHLAREKRIVSKPKTGTSLSASGLRVDEFMEKSRPKQLDTVRGWLAQVPQKKVKAMLVSSVSVLARMVAEKSVLKRLEEALQDGDIVALAQDIPVPESLSPARGIRLFEAPDIGTMIDGTPRFKQLAEKHPFVIMENGRSGGKYVILPEKPVSLVLFRIVTMNPGLYEAARDPAFLALLEDLVTDLLSRELQQKAA